MEQAMPSRAFASQPSGCRQPATAAAGQSRQGLGILARQPEAALADGRGHGAIDKPQDDQKMLVWGSQPRTWARWAPLRGKPWRCIGAALPSLIGRLDFTRANQAAGQ